MKFCALFVILAVFPFSVHAENTLLQDFLFSTNRSDWVIRIDDYSISRPELLGAYRIYLEQIKSRTGSTNDTLLLRKAFLDTYIQQYVIAHKALQEEFFTDTDHLLQLRIIMLQSINQIYLNEQIDPEDPDLQPTSEEINQLFQANREQLSQSGLSALQMQQALEAEILQQKISFWLQDYVTRAREATLIQRNSPVLKKAGFE